MRHLIAVQTDGIGVVRPAQADILVRAIDALLGADEDAVVVLDFTGVDRVTRQAVDRLMAPLFDRLGDSLPDRVFLDGCAASVLADLREVAQAGQPVEVRGFQVAAHGRKAA